MKIQKCNLDELMLISSDPPDQWKMLAENKIWPSKVRSTKFSAEVVVNVVCEHKVPK